VYVCICNGVTEDDVRSCVAAGAYSTKHVKEACDWRPGCGSCTGRLAGLLREAHCGAQLTMDAIAGLPLSPSEVSGRLSQLHQGAESPAA
jgi:bacterioferritin-associated ferredoxin